MLKECELSSRGLCPGRIFKKQGRLKENEMLFVSFVADINNFFTILVCFQVV